MNHRYYSHEQNSRLLHFWVLPIRSCFGSRGLRRLQPARPTFSPPPDSADAGGMTSDRDDGLVFSRCFSACFLPAVVVV